MQTLPTAELERTPLHRGGTVVSSILGAFGSSLRETRLTAMLGYLVALSPSPFEAAFGLRGRVLSVTLEANHQEDRSDILIQTTQGDVVVEAKKGTIDPLAQATKYSGKWYVLLTNYRPITRNITQRNVRYLTWQEVATILGRISRNSAGPAKWLSQDLTRYMEEHRMIRSRESVEVYAREINEEITLNLFLKARIYGCSYERSSRVGEALYFAPHFGKSIANAHPGIRVGISYVAKIDNVEVVDGWKQLLEVATAIRSRVWLRKHLIYLEGIHKSWEWGEEKHSFLFLGEPHLVFNPAVKKENLQAGRGWLSKRTFSFDELFRAWGM